MKSSINIAIGSDGHGEAVDATCTWLVQRGYILQKHGVLDPHAANPWQWPIFAREVVLQVMQGEATLGILFCWTGTGVCMAANKVKGIRAALCADAEIAEGARKWNDANVLVMSIQKTSAIMATEILDAWFETKVSEDTRDQACLRLLDALDHY